MTTEEQQEALEVLISMQKWRRSQPPYEGSNTMPHTPSQYGKALDIAIAVLTQNTKP